MGSLWIVMDNCGQHWPWISVDSSRIVMDNLDHYLHIFSMGEVFYKTMGGFFRVSVSSVFSKKVFQSISSTINQFTSKDIISIISSFRASE